MAGRIADRVAIVTGGASGIGKATAEVFAQEGAKVVIGDLSDSEGEKVAKDIGGMFVATDVRDPKQIEELVRTAVDKFGGLDIMFNKRRNRRHVSAIGAFRRALFEHDSHRSRRCVLRTQVCGKGDGGPETRIDHQYRVGGRNPRQRRVVGIQRSEARRSRTDPQCCARIRVCGSARELRVPGNHRYPARCSCIWRYRRNPRDDAPIPSARPDGQAGRNREMRAVPGF